MNRLRIQATIEQMIFRIRGSKVMVDRDLAQLYQVRTEALNQAVKRNRGRFPPDFAFRLSEKEKRELITACDRLSVLKHSPRPPVAFTEQGIAMLSSVLHSERAILVNVEIVRTFVRLRSLLAANRDLAEKLDHLEEKYDAQFKVVFDAIRDLMNGSAGSPSSRPLIIKGFAGD